jgi:hypothetical protein
MIVRDRRGGLRLRQRAITRLPQPPPYASHTIFRTDPLERETEAPGTIHVFLDNARYFKSREVKAWLQTARIRLHFLPPYSPNLNPIERLWRFMYQKVLANQYFEKFAGFKAAIFGFFDKIDSYRSELQTRLTDNFQRIQPLPQP